MVENAPQDKLGLNLLAAIFPLALIAVVLIKAWPLIIAILVISAIYKTWQHYQWQEWSAKIDPTFQGLISQNEGCVTITDLAIAGNLTARAAKLFLEKKADEFGAQTTVKNETTIYYFWTTSALASLFNNSEPETDEAQTLVTTVTAPRSTSEASSAIHFEAIAVAEQTSSGTMNEPSSVTKPMKESSDQSKEVNNPDNLPSTDKKVEEDLSSLAEQTPQTTATTTAFDQALEPEAPLDSLPAESVPEEMVEEERSISYFLDDEDEDEADPNQAINYFPDDDDDDNDESSGSLPSELIQSELAKRLNVHPSTVAKFRSKVNFKQWTKSKDPDSLSWSYIRKTKMYVVVKD